MLLEKSNTLGLEPVMQNEFLTPIVFIVLHHKKCSTFTDQWAQLSSLQGRGYLHTQSL